MASDVRNQLAVYLADLFALGGAVLLLPDALAFAQAGGAGTGRVVADLVLVAAGLLGHRIALTSLREAPIFALALLVVGSLCVVWLTDRWWVPTAAGAAAAAVAPQFLVPRRAAVWGGAGALLGLCGIVAGPATAALAAGFVVAVSLLSFRLAAEQRGSSSRTAVDLERTLEVDPLDAPEVPAPPSRQESRGRGGPRRSALGSTLTRRLGAVQAIALTMARDLKLALAAQDAGAIAAAAERGAAGARRLAGLAAGGEARERQTTLSLVWPRVLGQLGAEVAPSHHLEVSLPESLPPVPGGTEEWAQILAALVDNAVEAMPNGGIVRVRADASERPGCVRVIVEDSGPGIPPEILPHVLEPFYTSRKVAGAEGLGLAMVASLVEALDGEIKVVSEPGAGARVEIEVPYHVAEARPAAAAMALTGCVLVADDDKEFRRSMVRLLESFGLEALDVDGGTVALAHLTARPDRFRAAILDVVMPGTPVSEVVAEFRERRPRFPFLLVSGLASAQLLDGLLALGGVGFLRKPFTREELFYALRDLFTVEGGNPTPATPSSPPEPTAA